jgi:hypothetical protein
MLLSQTYSAWPSNDIIGYLTQKLPAPGSGLARPRRKIDRLRLAFSAIFAISLSACSVSMIAEGYFEPGILLAFFSQEKKRKIAAQTTKYLIAPLPSHHYEYCAWQSS